MKWRHADVHPELDPTVVAACRAVMQEHAKSFSRAARFLPWRLRDPVAVLYAFCREADDAIDLAPSEAVARERAERMIAELAPAGTSSADLAPPPDPVVRAFLQWSAHRPLARLAARELLAGIASDVGPVRVQDEGELIRYGYRVAGTVGLLMCSVFEVHDPVAHPFAIDLGIAMQLTNIARDVAEDATRDRVYLPEAWLRQAGTSQAALTRGESPAVALAPSVARLLDLADRFYASAALGIRFLPAEARPAILVASHLYRGIGEVLRARGHNPLLGRAVVPPSMRPALITRALGSAAAHALGRGPRGTHDASLHAPLAGLPGANPLASQCVSQARPPDEQVRVSLN
jgi:phytoene synthase